MLISDKTPNLLCHDHGDGCSLGSIIEGVWMAELAGQHLRLCMTVALPTLSFCPSMWQYQS